MTKHPSYQKSKKFLKVPRVSGGKKELSKFLKENLRYPQKAREAKMEGDVIIKYKISDNGDVFDPEVVKGIGYGCDEEAKRLVSMLLYDPVKNRGARVTAHNKLKIPFRLPPAPPQINVVYTPEKKKPETEKKKQDSPGSYTITIG